MFLALGAYGGAALLPGLDVSPSALVYSQKTAFTISGASLSKMEKIIMKKCAGLVLQPITTPDNKKVSCTVNGSVEVLVELKDAADLVLFTKTLNVAEPLLMTTNWSELLLKLDPEAAPVMGSNFMAYVNAGFYNNTFIHRVVPNSLIPGSWINSAPAVQTGQRNPITLEYKIDLPNFRRTLGMARASDSNSTTSQF